MNAIYTTALGTSLVPDVSGFIAQLTLVLQGHRSKPQWRCDIFRFHCNYVILEIAFTIARIFLNFKINIVLNLC